MFGYLKINTKYCNKELKKAYKNYYCGLCFSLEKHYGSMARFLVNYDVTLLAIVLHCHKSSQIKRLPCLGQKRKKDALFFDDIWDKLAAITVLLAAEKMNDDINDEGSISAFIGRLLFKKQIKNAKIRNPELYAIISDGYRKIMIDEKENKSVIDIGNRFANMMCELIKLLDNSIDSALLYVNFISKWLYYIDALDDYDEDIKKDRFNPLVMKNVSFEKYANEYYTTVQKDLQNIFSDFKILKKSLGNNSVENQLLLNVISDTIPTITYNILKTT